MTKNVEPDDFDSRWEDIVTELSDLDSAEFATLDDRWPETDEVETVASVSAKVAGPRDWTPPEEDASDVDEGDEQEGFVSLSPSDDETAPTAASTKFLWAGAGIFLCVATLSAFGIVPGGSTVIFGLGTLGFALAAFAAFSSSPRSEEIDPFDDGARL